MDRMGYQESQLATVIMEITSVPLLSILYRILGVRLASQAYTHKSRRHIHNRLNYI